MTEPQPGAADSESAERSVSPVETALGLLRSLRPHQWIKNGFVLAPVVFSLNIDEPTMLGRAGLATLFFCLISGSVYLLNDIADVEADRAHPVKRNRPIAAGIVPIPMARVACATFCVASIAGIYLISRWAALVAAIYFIVNVAYSMRLKHTAFVDVTIIATGFLLRILAGSLAIDVPVSTWLVTCTFLLALYLALGKRRHELLAGDRARKQRAVLERYNPRHVHLAMIVVGALTVAAYTAYTLAPSTQAQFGFDWPRLVLTVPFTALGIWRFFKLASDETNPNSPTEQMLRDVPFILNIAGWVLAVLMIVYIVN